MFGGGIFINLGSLCHSISDILHPSMATVAQRIKITGSTLAHAYEKYSSLLPENVEWNVIKDLLSVLKSFVMAQQQQ